MELPKFKKVYRIEDTSFEVDVKVYQNPLGCYMADVRYRAVSDTQYHKKEFVLNGPGKGKIEHDIIRFLKQEIRDKRTGRFKY